jgi:cysteine desulfurase
MAVDDWQVDLLSISAHKLYGPKGVGALYVRMSKPRVRLVPQMDGGGHEKGRRSGTLNVPGCVGFGAACALAEQHLPDEPARLTGLRERLMAALWAGLDHLHLNGHPVERLPGNLNVSFGFVEGESLLMALKGVAVSSGSACTSATLEPSYVLLALGVRDELAYASIRFGLGRGNTEEEVNYVAGQVVENVTRLRALSPLYEMALEGIDMKSIPWSLPAS